MNRAILIGAAALVPLLATAASATPCAEQIATIERRLESPGAARVTGEVPTTTGSPKALPAPPPGQPSDPATKPEAGHIAEARTLIAKAREQDRAGQADACNDTMTRAKEKIGALP
ncbi:MULTISPECIES: hypothetical protein [Methylobacterium]|jgi:hypothetical protein|uniref:hypothetical protein n=1 Tax=Methylobacterium TaxID=407 RepID=UPI0008EE5EB3|nr:MULTISPECIES: hypothetical protein [Methylobacterium]MBK3399997.1 hypothetical protein [Methylobacterium ajmalii]MBK3411134.1 hypothetical protein [Methylobacterium ajmalii]MBZ6412754.1 hypothetical protein [Methylobacterium sp.]SFF26786.1 hypothetical protein SAMN04487844_11325 [Methylobacterium sp. yr596]